MFFLENYSLKSSNTFGIDAKARYYKEFSTVEELRSIIGSKIYKENQRLILGGGSNILFTKDFDGLVLKNKIKGIEIKEPSNDCINITAGAGEIWHDLVMFCVQRNIGGIENLSLIPGTVGASPLQNIGAYGIELKDVFTNLEAVDADTGEIKYFNKEECCFGYRDSIFKNDLKGKFVISKVTLSLKKEPAFNISYGAIKSTLEEMGITDISVKAISDAVIAIRSSKLPDPAQIGNAGSFFKNPEISIETFASLKTIYADIVNYPTTPGMTKLPAGWLIEKCGWKGKIVGNTGVHKNQALVLVNYGNANGEEIRILSEEIKLSVKNKFGITLETEVNIV